MSHSTDSGEPPMYSKDMEKATDRMPTVDAAGGVVNGHETIEAGTHENFALKKGLKGRHMQMIAIGGSIGTGLFVGSGGALANGGPASLVICFILLGIMLLFTVSALAELAVAYPVNGAFFTHTVKFLDPAWGFAMGWNYAMSWLVVLPLELTAAGITIDYWNRGAEINVAVWITVFLVTVSAVNFFGVKGYGEVEFVIGLIKVIAIIGFIIVGIIINCGGVPTQTSGYIGGRYWQNGMAFENGFKGFCSVFVTAAFSYAGTELCGLAAAESANPAKSVPKASKQVFWRIAIFYVVSLTIVGLDVNSQDGRLLSATSSADTKASPFVIAISDANIYALPSIFNAVITLSVLSVANSSTYGSTRTLQALAMKGMAPKFLGRVDSKGRPLWALIISLLFGCLAYINCANVGTQVFTWLQALSGLATLFTWGSICANHMRFRYAWKATGHSLYELPWHSPYGVWGSLIGLVINILALVAQFYVALFPIGGDPDAEAFFESYLAFPIVIAFYVGYKVYEYVVDHHFQLWNSIDRMRLMDGVRLHTVEQVEEKIQIENATPKWKKFYGMLC